MAPKGKQKTTYVAVIGGGQVNHEVADLARRLGQELARRGAVVICGGLGGVMEAVAQGVKEANGVCLGILPDPDRRRANPYLSFSIATNMGHARNVIIVHSADALIAVDGSYGTISEAAVALKLGKPVIGLMTSWNLPGMQHAADVLEAVALALAENEKRRLGHRPES